MMLLLLALFLAHWLGDFVYQTRWMADNKSKSMVALGAHVGVYSLFIAVPAAFYAAISLNVGSALTFVLINAVAHFCTDAVTSRLTSNAWHTAQHYRKMAQDPDPPTREVMKKNLHSRANEETSKFFQIIGFDQFLHHSTLLVTAVLLLRVASGA